MLQRELVYPLEEEGAVREGRQEVMRLCTLAPVLGSAGFCLNLSPPHPFPPFTQACNLDDSERKVQELWEPLAAYEPPCIELPPPPPPPAEEQQQPAEEQMVDAAPEEAEPSADDLPGSVQAEPEGAAGELETLEVAPPDAEDASEAEAAPAAGQPSLVAPTAEPAAEDSEMAEGQAEGSSANEGVSEGCSMDDEQVGGSWRWHSLGV